jgi:hypothetical protein
LSPGGSTHLHTNNKQNNTNNNRTTQITNSVEERGPCPDFASFYPGICLTTEKKARKNHSQGKRNFSQVNKNLSQGTVYIVCCMVEVSATVRSLVQRSPAECGVSECDRETSQRRPKPNRAVEQLVGWGGWVKNIYNIYLGGA